MRRALLAAVFVSLLVPLVALADDPVITVPAEHDRPGPELRRRDRDVHGVGGRLPRAADRRHVRSGIGRALRVREDEGHLHGQGGQPYESKHFDVTVVDTQPPAITVPPPRTVSTTKRAGKVVEFGASASDLVDGLVAVACAPASGLAVPGRDDDGHLLRARPARQCLVGRPSPSRSSSRPSGRRRARR